MLSRYILVTMNPPKPEVVLVFPGDMPFLHLQTAMLSRCHSRKKSLPTLPIGTTSRLYPLCLTSRNSARCHPDTLHKISQASARRHEACHRDVIPPVARIRARHNISHRKSGMSKNEGHRESAMLSRKEGPYAPHRDSIAFCTPPGHRDSIADHRDKIAPCRDKDAPHRDSSTAHRDNVAPFRDIIAHDTLICA